MKITQTTTVTMPKQATVKTTGGISMDAFVEMLADELDKLNAIDYKKYFIHLRDQAVKAFYSSYYPRYYKRKYSLRYMAYPLIEDNEFFMDLGVDNPGYFAKHHQDEEYIYENSFQRGYHGGAYHNGVPTWRTPYPTYEVWGWEAPQGPSPYLIIKDGWSSFLSGEALSIQAKNRKIALAKYHGAFKSLIANELNKMNAGGGK